MPTIKTVYIVRHGQSVDNGTPVYQSYDSPLSDIGLVQANKIAERAKHIEFDALISSPQMRASQTADAIAKSTDTSKQTSHLLIERFKPTSIDGKSWNDEIARDTWRQWEKSLVTPGIKVEDGENYDDIVDRADQALKYFQDLPEKKLLVVTHGHFIRTVIARVMLGDALTGELLKRFYELTSLENTAITVLKYRDAFEEDFRWRLWTLNDHTHFAE